MPQYFLECLQQYLKREYSYQQCSGSSPTNPILLSMGKGEKSRIHVYVTFVLNDFRHPKS